MVRKKLSQSAKLRKVLTENPGISFEDASSQVGGRLHRSMFYKIRKELQAGGVTTSRRSRQPKWRKDTPSPAEAIKIVGSAEFAHVLSTIEEARAFLKRLGLSPEQAADLFHLLRGIDKADRAINGQD